MLAYRHVVLRMLTGSVIFIILAWAYGLLSIWFILVLILLNLGLLIAGSFWVCSGLYIQAHCKGAATKKQIALSFDDGPHPSVTPAVLDILKAHNIKAAFFLIGKNIEQNKDILRRIVDEGHIIGNHSYAHSNSYGFWSRKKVLADLLKNQDLIETVCNKKINLFRPPFGVTNPNIANAAQLLDYTVVGWSIRSLDTMSKNNAHTIKRVLHRLKSGRVLLFHDKHERILPILQETIRKAVEEGYEIVPLDKLLDIKPYK